MGIFYMRERFILTPYTQGNEYTLEIRQNEDNLDKELIKCNFWGNWA